METCLGLAGAFFRGRCGSHAANSDPDFRRKRAAKRGGGMRRLELADAELAVEALRHSFFNIFSWYFSAAFLHIVFRRRFLRVSTWPEVTITWVC
jgi:hypothetical protein